MIFSLPGNSSGRTFTPFFSLVCPVIALYSVDYANTVRIFAVSHCSPTSMLFLRRYYDTLSIVLELLVFSLISVPYVSREIVAQDGGFELPVQLVGFPVIIIAVRMSNFVRKLAYSLNPNTYRRSVRATSGVSTPEPSLNFAKADKELVRQLGPDFCVYEDVCLEHVRTAGTKNRTDWHNILNNFSQLAQSKQQYYLLSVFLGDIIGSAKLCQHFKETGRICH